VDSDSPKSGCFTYLGVDNYEGGKAAADLLVKTMGTSGEVALLTGVPGAFNPEERIRGFKDGVKGCPGIEIVKTMACSDDINQGVQVVEETMLSKPDLTGWFFVGLWPLFANRGSMKSWEEAAQSGAVKTIAFATLPVELDYRKSGYLSGLISAMLLRASVNTPVAVLCGLAAGLQEPWTVRHPSARSGSATASDVCPRHRGHHGAFPQAQSVGTPHLRRRR
jgi:ABC-type sugar transport system substrate-binding protein